MARTGRDGFTLIELLVVAAIVGVLIGLLVPAVQKVRASAARMACSNNIRQLNMALLNYESVRNCYPYSDTKTPKHGWAIHLLPFLEQENLAKKYNWDQDWFHASNAPVIGTHLSVFQCPMAEPNRLDQYSGTDDGVAITYSASVTDYVVLRGVHENLWNGGLIDPLNDGTRWGPLTKHDDKKFLSPGKRNMITDGTSNTIWLSESYGRPDFYQLEEKVEKYNKKGEKRVEKGGAWAAKENAIDIRGSLFDGSLDDTTILTGPCAINCTNDRNVYSLHIGGANAAFADGSVRFLGQGISIRTFAGLITRNAGEILPPLD